MLSYNYEDAFDQLQYPEADGEQAWARRYPASVQAAINMGALAWPVAVQRAIDSGIRDLNRLTDIAFFMHFPELNGKQVQSDHPKIEAFRQTWKFLRTGIEAILQSKPGENVGEKVGHGSGGMILRRAA